MSVHSLSGRLIVTGHAADGMAVIVADEVVPDTELAGHAVRLRSFWARDDIATFPDSGNPPAVATRVPPPGGTRFAALTIAAGATREYHAFVIHAMGDLAEPAQPGFHTTPTLDFILVLDGELVLEVDGRDERTLRKGDAAVLNGVRHRWHNRGADDATLMAVMIGARTSNGRES